MHHRENSREASGNLVYKSRALQVIIVAPHSSWVRVQIVKTRKERGGGGSKVWVSNTSRQNTAFRKHTNTWLKHCTVAYLQKPMDFHYRGNRNAFTGNSWKGFLVHLWDYLCHKNRSHISEECEFLKNRVKSVELLDEQELCYTVHLMEKWCKQVVTIYETAQHTRLLFLTCMRT